MFRHVSSIDIRISIKLHRSEGAPSSAAIFFCIASASGERSQSASSRVQVLDVVERLHVVPEVHVAEDPREGHSHEQREGAEIEP